MAIKDIFLPLVGEPNAAAIAAIDKCMAVSSGFGAHVTAVAAEESLFIRPKVMISSDLKNTEQPEALRSVTDARGLLRAFDAAANRCTVRNEQRLGRLTSPDVPGHFVESARLADLSMVPVKPDDGQSEKIAERLIFKSGRPVLLCPEESAGDLPVGFNRVVMGWDHSAPAARAVADALPLLQGARDVRIVTATDETTEAELESGASLVRHLAEHGIAASFAPVAIDGSSVGNCSKPT